MSVSENVLLYPKTWAFCELLNEGGIKHYLENSSHNKSTVFMMEGIQ